MRTTATSEKQSSICMDGPVKSLASVQIKCPNSVELRFRNNSSGRQEILMNMVHEDMNSNNDFCDDSFQIWRTARIS